ncbi:hypothetical protein N665_0048s0013 [Sinapis alba]|nr:hypothetical protein N665_0048s0013 [Sinapis alba]
MPKPDNDLLKKIKNSMLRDEMTYNMVEQEEEHNKLIHTLNEEQKIVYEAVIDSIDSMKGKLFFLNGPGGTGKTYVYKTIISRLILQGKIVLPVASSGIAAILLPNGRTAHSRFKIPIDLHQDSMCNISRGTMLSELLEKLISSSGMKHLCVIVLRLKLLIRHCKIHSLWQNHMQQQNPLEGKQYSLVVILDKFCQLYHKATNCYGNNQSLLFMELLL